MYLGIINVKPLDAYKLLLTFENNETRVLDMSPYLDKGLYKQLKDVSLFKTVKISFDTIEWANEIDLCPEFAYKKSIPVNKIPINT
ncbi:uncharacterized protein DUF2442 [Natranaerovirga hydrolytica]|uniref:Uncharacterized protein DUF2442 n=1 Tax=Natranaerovirga hydrolytica TaxID=680378 RepID=A0A4R1N510_9FIRM|nr:DUF2442 domain-containing protein [Natranaerovirga hydrolytica]TCK98049.1 uncharacterized protein DUF2442 [Natranaerovirga hydrolytica]